MKLSGGKKKKPMAVPVSKEYLMNKKIERMLRENSEYHSGKKKR